MKIAEGMKIHKWTVGTRVFGKSKHPKWNCVCECGNASQVRQNKLANGESTQCKSCGNTKHGLVGTETYARWESMRNRCNSPRASNYARYGGRGITVCDRWESFNNFLADMGECPPGMSLERLDVDGNYTLENCVWADRAMQARNKRNNVFVTYLDRRMCIADWATELGMNAGTLYNRASKGWTDVEIIEGR